MMGKKRKRSAKDPESASSVTRLSSFDESALSALTNKIESGFHNAAAPRQDLRDRKTSTGEDPRSRIDKAEDSKSYKKNRVSGKKRDAHGNVREQTGSGTNTAHIRTDGHSGQDNDEQKVLLQEILALGGTEDDVDLVMGVATDEDDALDNGLDKISAYDPKLTKELSKFITSLGIETRYIQESSGAESGEDVVAESEDIPDPSPPKPANTMKDVSTSGLQCANSSVKRPKNLVSKS